MSADSYKRSPEGMLEDFKERIEQLERRIFPTRLGSTGREVTNWNFAVESGFYWSNQNATNRPPNGSWSSAIVYRNDMPGFERVIQDAMQPTTSPDTMAVEWRRVAFPDGAGGWAWGTWQPLPGVRGTTTQRDVYFSPPTTDAQRAALANRRIQYFNTTLGWEESYYATTGITGLTATGLEAGTPSGWYPTGRFGPKLVRTPSVESGVAGPNVLGGFDTAAFHRGGNAHLEYTSNGVITVKIPGRYRVRWRTTTQPGAGALDMWIYAGGVFGNDAWDLYPSLIKEHDYEYADIALAANDTCYAWVNAGSCNVHTSSSTRRGEFLVEYLGPRLVNS